MCPLHIQRYFSFRSQTSMHFQIHLNAIFHCSRFDHAGGATDFNLAKNQSRGDAKKVKFSPTLSVSARTKADRKRSDWTPIAKVENCSLRPPI